MTDRPRNVVVGYGACPCCGKGALPIKANKKGRLYVYCPTPADSGCACATQSRSDAADKIIAEKFVSKWVNPEYRRVYLAASGPTPARVPAAKPPPRTRPAQKPIGSVKGTAPASDPPRVKPQTWYGDDD